MSPHKAAVGGRSLLGIPLDAYCVLFCLALAHALFVLAVGIDQPLVDLHAFRQTQTAVSAYWLAKEGFRLDYQTPVLGWPWSIPFEFPLFQLLAAWLSRLGVPLDAAGRGLAFFFFLASLLPMRVIARRMSAGRNAFLITATLFLACPIYLYWGRAFLMETCALFFGLLWLSLVMVFVDDERPVVALAAFAAGCLAVLVKATTFPAFGMIGGLIVIARLVRAGTTSFRLLWSALIFGLAPLLVGSAWIVYADHLKSKNPIGLHLTSAALSSWNYGTVRQRLSIELWMNVVWTRVLPDVLGAAFPAAIVVLIAALASRRHRRPMLLALAAFLLPFLVFTNLHMVHNYYQAANAIFLIAAVGIAVARIDEAVRGSTGRIILCAIAIGQIAVFYERFYPEMRDDGSRRPSLQIAAMAAKLTKPENSLLIIGQDWSSTIAYYSGRRSMSLPPWVDKSFVEKLFADPQDVLGNAPLGGIVYCSAKATDYRALAPQIDAFLAGREKIAEAGDCSLLSARRRPGPPP